MNPIIDNGLESLEESHRDHIEVLHNRYLTFIGVVIALGVFAWIYLWHAYIKSKVQERVMIEYVVQKDIAHRDSLQYFVDTSLVDVSRVVAKGKK